MRTLRSILSSAPLSGRVLTATLLLATSFGVTACANTSRSAVDDDTGASTDGDATGTTDGDVADGQDATDATDGQDATDGSDGQDATDGADGQDGSSEVVECNAPAPAAPPGTAGCSVEAGGTLTLISGDILAPDKVYLGGSVLLGADGLIQCVGCDCAAQAGDATKVICPDAVVSPGLINAHDHVGWMNDAPWVATENDVDPALRWEHRHDWRKGKRSHPSVKTGGGGASEDERAFGELRFVLGGGTAIFGSGAGVGLLRDLDKTGGGESGLSGQGAEYQTFPLGDSGGELIASGCDYPKPVGAENGAFVPHVSEGIDPEARNEFLCLTGQGQGAVDILDGNSAIVHGVGLNATDVAFMQTRGIGLVWSPRSNVSLYGETARVTLMHSLGIQIGLGTDWIPSGSMNMLRELACADYLNQNHFGGFFSDEDLWRMATFGAAATLGVDAEIGALAVGYAGDVAIFAKSGRTAHRAVVAASVGDLIAVFRGGKVVAGNAPVVDGLESGCDSLGDVCGQEKKACITRDVGKSWGSIQNAKGYELFFCGVPDREPTCVPTRTLPGDSIDGSTLYGASMPDDADGDGVAGAADLCPTIFNPIRPLDGGKQADADQDLVGDECDPCPLDADSTSCSKFDPNDPDKDEIPTTADNCPTVPNKDQADGDSDQKGDLCDDCPEYSNPGAAGCLAAIVDVKTLDAFEGKIVAIENLVVTAVGSNGFWAQTDADPPVDHSGVFAFTGAVPTVKVGDGITVQSATVSKFFGQVQLTQLTVKVDSSENDLFPIGLQASQLGAIVGAGSEASFEGMLVTVLEPTVINAKPAGGAGDTDAVNEVELTGGLRLDDAIWPKDVPYLNPPQNGDTFGAITGVLAWRNGYLKLLPRGTADVLYGDAKAKALSPAVVFQRIGKSGATFPEVLRIELSNASGTPTDVTLESSDDSIMKPALTTLTIPAGALTADIDIEGLTAGEATLSATAGGKTVTASVRVLADDEEPAVVAVSPAAVNLVVDKSGEFDVTVAFPAPVAGMTVALSYTGGLTGPADVVIAGNELGASFTVTAPSDPGEGSITAAAGGEEATSTVTIVALSDVSLDIGGYKLVQTAADKSFTIPAGTMIQAGGYLVIARNSARAAFETFYGGPLAANVVFINSGDKFPSINGDETFSLVNAGGQVLDGPTVAHQTSKKFFTRAIPVVAASGAAAWTNPATATPGAGQGIDSKPNGVYISEWADPTGSGEFAYEFVELHFDGPKL